MSYHASINLNIIHRISTNPMAYENDITYSIYDDTFHISSN